MHLSDYIRNTSREAVVDGVRNIKRYHLSSQKIISNRNPLITNGTIAVGKHADVRKSYSIGQPKINSFLAASALSHLLDGWMYLSNAFNAILSGDEATAVHLGYYAELRSAMSILATEGIGVFNQKHIGAFSSNTNREYPTNYYKGPSYKRPGSPTHVFVWDAMEKWSNSAYKPNDEILKVFKVKGKDFYEITEYFHPSTGSSTLLTVQTVKDWLKEWCFDIKTYRNDRENRNEVSYRPQRIKNFDRNINFKNILNDLDGYWSVISPSNTDKFSLLDKYLLRKLFDNIYPNLVTTETKRDLIENAFTQQGINDQTLFNFLNFEEPFENDHIIFRQASIKQTTPLSIIARATLLLRISVGLVSQLYKAGGINKNELNFIWNNYAVENGFWPNGNPLENFDDLWGDIQPLLIDLQTDINTPEVDNSLYSIKQRNHESILYFGQINRACLWGMDF